MEYAILTILLWALLTGFWMDAERRAKKTPLEIVVVAGRDLTVTFIPGVVAQ